MKTNTLLFLCLLCSFSLSGQSFNWEYYPYEGEFDRYDSTLEILEDSQGNIYTVGYFEENAYIYGDTLAVDGFNSDLLIVKYHPDRSIAWYKELDLNEYARYFEVAFDSRENLVLAGEYEDTLQINTTQLVPAIEQSAFITKITPEGEVLWLKSVLDGYPTIHAMSMDDFDNIYIAGEGWKGGFLAMLNEVGEVQWRWDINSPGGGNNVWGADIKKAPDGSVYGLLLWQSERINITESITHYSPYSWGVQMSLFKFNEVGEIIWIDQNKAGRFNDNAFISVDNASNVYVAGSFNNAPLELGDKSLPIPDFNRSFGFIAKCTPDKEWEWIYQRDPFPNLSRNMLFDCKNELLYSVGSSSLEVFNTDGMLQQQRLFDQDRVYPQSISLGYNNELLFCGLMTMRSFAEPNSIAPLHPFIVGVDYGWDIYKRPPAPSIASKIYICPESTELTLSVAGDSINWYESTDLTTILSTEKELIIDNPTAAIYYVSQHNSDGCESKKAKVELVNLNDLQLTFKEDTLFAPYDHAFTYQWSFDGELLPDVSSAYLPVDSAGTYTVNIKVADCQFDLAYVLMTTSTTNPIEKSIEMYPTLFMDYVTLHSPALEQDATLLIHNTMGQLISNQAIPNNQEGNYIINTNTFPKGIYLFTLKTAKGSFSQKLIKS